MYVYILLCRHIHPHPGKNHARRCQEGVAAPPDSMGPCLAQGDEGGWPWTSRSLGSGQCVQACSAHSWAEDPPHVRHGGRRDVGVRQWVGVGPELLLDWSAAKHEPAKEASCHLEPLPGQISGSWWQIFKHWELARTLKKVYLMQWTRFSLSHVMSSHDLI